MQAQRGFALLELIVAALIATLLAVWGAGMLADRFKDARAQAMAMWMLSVRASVQSYVQRYGGEMALAARPDALSVHGYGDWRRPSLSELKADGLLSPGFPEAGPGALRVGIRLLPGTLCPGEGCAMQALVYSTGAILQDGSQTIDREMIAQWLLAARGLGGKVDPRHPLWIRGAAFGFPNPPDDGMAALAAGTIAMAVTAEQTAGANFLRVRDHRNPDFQGGASARGDITSQKSLIANEYLFVGRQHNMMSLCDQEGAIARETRRGLLVCRDGTWQSAGAGGGGFATNSLYGCQAPDGAPTANPVTGRCTCPEGYSMVIISDSGANASASGRTRGFLCVG